SADLLDHLIESNKGLREAFESYGLTDSDIHFIKELIFVRFVFFFPNLNSSTLHTYTIINRVTDTKHPRDGYGKVEARTEVRQNSFCTKS
ncbi:MAG: hypothetical protein CMO04_21215, partial [Thalassospira sp.]|nr:hypothetical protein [Thalassospira sp.]